MKYASGTPIDPERAIEHHHDQREGKCGRGSVEYRFFHSLLDMNGQKSDHEQPEKLDHQLHQRRGSNVVAQEANHPSSI
jgi:hypothetical protein